MDKYAAGTRASELSLVEIPIRPEDPPVAGAIPQPQADTVGADRFLKDAKREFHEGRIDQPLWVRALAQAGGDEKLAMPAYLRARATALRLAKRDERAGRASGRARARDNLGEDDCGGGNRSKAASSMGGLFGSANRKYLIWAAGAITGVVLVAVLVTLRSTRDATPHPAVAAPSPSSRAADGVPRTAAAPTAPNPAEDFAGRTKALKDAGNWNVLVLYAVEWTRRQPENPLAWKELSAGYLKLRQLDDALSTAKKAVELAPADDAMWRNLGQVDMATNDLAAAAESFEHADTLNDRDVETLVQLGTLNLRLGRTQPAKAAFARALATRPDDADALCGNASVAQQEGRAKDAEAIVLQVKASGGTCRPSSADAAVVVATPPANSKAAAIPRR